MIFPDNIFKYTSSMVKHIPEPGSRDQCLKPI